MCVFLCRLFSTLLSSPLLSSPFFASSSRALLLTAHPSPPRSERGANGAAAGAGQRRRHLLYKPRPLLHLHFHGTLTLNPTSTPSRYPLPQPYTLILNPKPRTLSPTPGTLSHSPLRTPNTLTVPCAPTHEPGTLSPSPKPYAVHSPNDKHHSPAQHFPPFPWANMFANGHAVLGDARIVPIQIKDKRTVGGGTPPGSSGGTDGACAASLRALKPFFSSSSSSSSTLLDLIINPNPKSKPYTVNRARNP
jgi:hypothetical protein